jgi:hypothetical protein
MTPPDAEAPPRRAIATVTLQLRRLALVGSQGGLLIPFVSVQDCSGGDPEVITGLQLVTTDQGWVLGIPLFLSMLLLVGTLRRRSPLPGWGAFSAAAGALLAAAGGLIAGGLPHVAYLFDTVRPQAGWFVVVACWSFLYVEGLVRSGLALLPAGAPRGEDLWDPVCRVLRWLVLVLPWPVALLVEPDLDEALLGAAVVMGAASLPLWFALTACVVGIRRQEPWAAGWTPVVAALVSATAAFSCLAASVQ